VACRYKLDLQNNRLARGVALFILTGGPNALPKRGDGDPNAYDALVCERFALGFTYYDSTRRMAERAIAGLESPSKWSDFDRQLDERLGFYRAAELQVSLLREEFFDRLKEQKAA